MQMFCLCMLRQKMKLKVQLSDVYNAVNKYVTVPDWLTCLAGYQKKICDAIYGWNGFVNFRVRVCFILMSEDGELHRPTILFLD